MAVDTPPTAYLVACTDTGYGDVVPLIPTIRYSLGRAPTNRIHLRDDLCSREHAEIYCHEGNWFLRDLGSLNGCHLNETKVETEQPLRPEDRVRMGTSRFLFAETLNQLPTPDFPTPSATSNIAIRTRLAETRYLPSQRVADDRTKVVAPQRLPASDAVQILFQLAVDSATAATPQALADFVLDGLFRATQAEVAAILAITPNRSLEPFAYRTRNPQMKTYHKVSHFVSTEVLNTKQAVLAEDVASEPSLKNRDSLSDLRAASLICAPVLADNDVQGLVHLYSGTANRRLNADDLDVVLAIARQFGIVWQRLKREAELSAEVRSLKDRLKLESSLIGQSAAIRKIEDQIARVAAARTTVLVRGESGVGKELVAHAIHFSSPRRDRPFICLNCAALTESLLESELFGHEKGAFTGATGRMIGKFESADGGSIFLDEIGEMSIGTQAKLLRVLEGQAFERVGGNTPIRVDVRVIAATNRTLEEAVKAGTFRKDLFYRLQVVQVDVPPLRERSEDLPLLADHFFQRYTHETGRKLKGFSEGALAKLKAYSWPGNVRELRNVIERAVVLAHGAQIEEGDIWLSALEPAPVMKATVEFEPLSLEAVEKLHITRTLEYTQWNKSRTAELLGIERSTLDRKIKGYVIKREG